MEEAVVATGRAVRTVPNSCRSCCRDPPWWACWVAAEEMCRHLPWVERVGGSSGAPSERRATTRTTHAKSLYFATKALGRGEAGRQLREGSETFVWKSICLYIMRVIIKLG